MACRGSGANPEKGSKVAVGHAPAVNPTPETPVETSAGIRHSHARLAEIARAGCRAMH